MLGLAVRSVVDARALNGVAARVPLAFWTTSNPLPTHTDLLTRRVADSYVRTACTFGHALVRVLRC
jgi:hypothetical protein